MDLDSLEDTRRTLIEKKPNNILCENEIKKAVNAAIYQAFPKDIKYIEKILEKYEEALKSDYVTRFKHFNFIKFDEKMKKIEEIEEVLKMLRFGVKELIQDIKFEKNNIKIEAEKWIEKIEQNGIKNINAGKVMFDNISDLEDKLNKIEPLADSTIANS